MKTQSAVLCGEAVGVLREVRYRTLERWRIQVLGEDRFAELVLGAVVRGHCRDTREAILLLGSQLLESN